MSNEKEYKKMAENALDSLGLEMPKGKRGPKAVENPKAGRPPKYRKKWPAVEKSNDIDIIFERIDHRFRPFKNIRTKALQDKLAYKLIFTDRPAHLLAHDYEVSKYIIFQFIKHYGVARPK